MATLIRPAEAFSFAEAVSTELRSMYEIDKVGCRYKTLHMICISKKESEEVLGHR